MSHFLDRFRCIAQKRETCADGHGTVTRGDAYLLYSWPGGWAAACSLFGSCRSFSTATHFVPWNRPILPRLMAFPGNGTRLI